MAAMPIAAIQTGDKILGWLTEGLAVVLQELLKALVSERVIEELIENLERHGADVCAGESRFDHMHGSAK